MPDKTGRGNHDSPRGRTPTGREPVSVRLSKTEQKRLDLVAQSRAEAVQKFANSLEWLRDAHEYLEVQAKIHEDKDAIELFENFPFDRFPEIVQEGEALGLIEVRDKNGEVSAIIV